MIEVDNINNTFRNGCTGCVRERRTGIITYMFNGIPHRCDGPAQEWPDGHKVWYWHGWSTLSENEWLDPLWRRKIEITDVLF